MGNILQIHVNQTSLKHKRALFPVESKNNMKIKIARHRWMYMRRNITRGCLLSQLVSILSTFKCIH